MEKIWQVKPKPPENFLKQFPEYPDFILQLLWGREIRTQEEMDEFFNPDYEGDLHDPFLMKGMKEAAERIEKAISGHEKIVIYGDYDTDGICASAILSETFKTLGAQDIDVYIPDRFKEGYGLNLNSVREIAQGGAKLLITVDLGITDLAEVDLANSLGLEVIVTDHHLVHGQMPKAMAVVDVRQDGDTYPFKWLTGTGVAFKLVQALLKNRRENGVDCPPEGWEKWLLDLVALATIADLQPLVGENRTLVKYGLIVLAKTRRLGLKHLMEVAGLDAALLDSWKISFLLTPRINAAGRINHADISYRLLVTDSPNEAEKLAQQLDAYNKERQQLVDGIVQEIKGNIDGFLAAGNRLPNLIFEGNTRCTAGTTGIVASRLAGQYCRPVMIYGFSESDDLRGTGRGIPGFSLVEAMEKCVKAQPDILVEFGGHAMAAGFTVKKSNLDTFKKLLQDIAGKEIKDDDMIPRLAVDLEMEPGKINWEMNDWLSKLEPFGEKNGKPVFLVKNLEVTEMRTVGNGSRHLKLSFKEPGGRIFPAIGFGLGERENIAAVGAFVDVVFELEVNEWNGHRELQMKIADFRPASRS